MDHYCSQTFEGLQFKKLFTGFVASITHLLQKCTHLQNPYEKINIRKEK